MNDDVKNDGEWFIFTHFVNKQKRKKFRDI
jgi:hypothetical protein